MIEGIAWAPIAFIQVHYASLAIVELADQLANIPLAQVDQRQLDHPTGHIILTLPCRLLNKLNAAVLAAAHTRSG